MNSLKEHPILFSAPMVRAILDGRKTQTRRVIKSLPKDGRWSFKKPPELGKIVSSHPKQGKFGVFIYKDLDTQFPLFTILPCPYGQPGDRLWVRETWRPCQVPQHADSSMCVEYAATDYCKSGHLATLNRHNWRPSIFMPRWASRITLEIVDIRVEHVQDISEEDARAEGIVWQKDFGNGLETRDARGPFADLWHSLNDPRGYGWNVNPYVWVIEFKKL